MKKIHRVNLRGLNTEAYEKNPVVLNNNDLTKPPLGTAKILRYKCSVLVTYKKVPKFDYVILSATIKNNGSKEETLLYLTSVYKI